MALQSVYSNATIGNSKVRRNLQKTLEEMIAPYTKNEISRLLFPLIKRIIQWCSFI